MTHFIDGVHIHAARAHEDQHGEALANQDIAQALRLAESAFHYAPQSSRDLVRAHILDTSRLGHPLSQHWFKRFVRWFF